MIVVTLIFVCKIQAVAEIQLKKFTFCYWYGILHNLSIFLLQGAKTRCDAEYHLVMAFDLTNCAMVD